MNKICLSCKKSLDSINFLIRKNGSLYSYCNDCHREKCKKYYNEHRQQALEKQKEYVKENKEKVKLSKHLKYLKRRNYYLDYNKKKYEQNKEKILNQHKNNRQYYNEYVRNKRKNDIKFNIAGRLRGRISNVIRKKSGNTFDLVGCDIETFLKYLESKFKDGMNWENRNLWEIDHIQPLSSFNLDDPNEQKIACHYTNLQPLWKSENRKKGKKW